MSSLPAALQAIAAEPPALDVDRVAAATETQFGLTGRYSPLVSERDQNFRLETADGRRFVVKVVGLAESADATALQIGALEHLASLRQPLAPTVVRTLDGSPLGSIEADGASHALRVVTYLEGEPLVARPMDRALAARFGSRLAALDAALAGFDYQGPNPVLLWDLQRAAELVGLLDYIDEAAVRDCVAAAVDDFATRALPALRTLDCQVIHGDPNPENVILTGERDDIRGFIDFGDAVRAPRIVDVAIGAAYLRNEAGDPLSHIAAFVAGYAREQPLSGEERDLLFDLVRARAATTVTLLYWRLRARSAGDPYRRKLLTQEAGAARFLVALGQCGPEAFRQRLVAGSV